MQASRMILDVQTISLDPPRQFAVSTLPGRFRWLSRKKDEMFWKQFAPVVLVAISLGCGQSRPTPVDDKPRSSRRNERHVFRVLAISPDGRRAVSSDGVGIATWDLISGQPLAPSCSYFSGTKDVTRAWVSLSFTADSKAVLIGTDGRDIGLWDAASGDKVAVFVSDDANVLALACSPDGRYAATADNGKLHLWDMKTCKESRILAKTDSAVYALAFSPDSKQVVSGSSASGAADHAIRLWDVETGKCLATFSGHEGGTTAIAMSSTGRFVLSGGADGEVKLWEVATSRAVRSIQVGLTPDNSPTNTITAVAFAAKDRQVLALARDQSPQLFDLASGNVVRTFFAGLPAIIVRQAQVVPGGKEALFAVNESLLLYDLTSGKELRKFGDFPLPPRGPSDKARE
jgi:WD40 repeat protein